MTGPADFLCCVSNFMVWCAVSASLQPLLLPSAGFEVCSARAGGWAVAVLFIAFFQRLEFFECTLWAIAGSVGAIAAASAFFESLPVDQWVDDNLSVPLLAALLGQCLFTKGALLIA